MRRFHPFLRVPTVQDSRNMTCIALSGDLSDCEFLVSQLAAESQNHEMTFPDRAGFSVHAIANLCRRVIASYIRKHMLKVNVLIAGWDNSDDRPVLYWLDNIGGMHEVPFGAHGRDFVFLLSLLDLKKGQLLTNNQIVANETSGVTSERSCGFSVAKDCWMCVKKRSAGYFGPSATVRAISATGATDRTILIAEGKYV